MNYYEKAYNKDLRAATRKAIKDQVAILQKKIDYEESATNVTKIKSALSSKVVAFETAKFMIKELQEIEVKMFDQIRIHWFVVHLKEIVDASKIAVDELVSSVKYKVDVNEYEDHEMKALSEWKKQAIIHSKKLVAGILELDVIKQKLRNAQQNSQTFTVVIEEKEEKVFEEGFAERNAK